MGSNNSSSQKNDNITKTPRTPLITESQQQQQQQPTQQHEETIDAIAAAAPVDDEDGVALANYFRELQLDLTKQMHERESRLPKCYEEGTFWITPPNAFFTLWNKTKKLNKNTANTTNTTTTTTNPTSPTTTATSSNNSIDDNNNNNTSNNNNNKNSDHPYSELICMKRPRIFVWLVHLLVDILYCPSETCHLKKLQSHGWATAPCARRILDLHSDFYLMSYRYKCTHCKRTFFGHDQAIRDSLPTALAEEFPAVLSHRSGISRSTLELMQSCSTSAIGPFTRILKEHHALRSARLKLQYLAAKKESETTLSHAHHSKKRKINNTTSSSASTPSSSSSFVAIAPQPISNLNQHQRLSVPLPIAPRPPQVTPVFLPQPIFAMHPHLVALQHQQQQQLQHSQQQQQQQALSPLSSPQQQQQQQQTNRRTSTTPIVPKTAIPLQPLYYTLPRPRPNSSSPHQGPTLQVLKKPRKPRTILKKPN
ncbi:hypothetical protein INT45_009341 [Circinella minor]|uniref:DUF6729 domain-containing protein n=1 Tax=Circinella minor TaxID=1195481 RepID=A0A8H7RST6_9FUNG|nr:hypothetical protein INT45_009341 [Circinella minor]